MTKTLDKTAPEHASITRPLVIKAVGLLTKAEDGQGRYIEGVASTPTPDRVEDIVEPEGVVIKTAPSLLLHHDRRRPVGDVIEHSVTSAGIIFRARFADVDGPPGLKGRIEEAYQSVKSGLIKYVSIGFRILEHTILDSGGWRITKWDWYELSLVTIPANPDAAISAVKSLGSLRSIRPSMGAYKHGAPLFAGVSAPVKTKTRKDADMNVAEEIARLEAERAKCVETMTSLTKGALDAGRTKDEAERERYDEASERVETIDQELSELRDLESKMLTAAPAVEATGDSSGDGSAARDKGQKSSPVSVPRRSIRIVPNEEEKGLGFARFAMCFAAAKGNGMYAAQLAEEHYRSDPRVAALAKAAVGGANTGTSAWAGSMAEPQGLINDFLEYLRPLTLLDRFGANDVPSLRTVPFNVEVGRMTTGTTASMTAEGKAAAVTKGAVDKVTLTHKKATALAVVTKEMLRFGNLSSERTIRNDLAKAVAQKKDAIFIGAQAASSGTPAGILNGVSAISSATGDDAASIRKDIQNIVDPFDDTDMEDDGIVIMTSGKTARGARLQRNALGQREFADVSRRGGLIEDYPMLSSNTVSQGNVIAVHAPSILYADDGEVTIDMATEATIVMDDAPTADATTGAGQAGVNLFQAGSVALLATCYFDFVVARPDAIQYIDDADWNGSPSA